MNSDSHALSLCQPFSPKITFQVDKGLSDYHFRCRHKVSIALVAFIKLQKARLYPCAASSTPIACARENQWVLWHNTTILYWPVWLLYICSCGCCCLTSWLFSLFLTTYIFFWKYSFRMRVKAHNAFFSYRKPSWIRSVLITNRGLSEMFQWPSLVI